MWLSERPSVRVLKPHHLFFTAWHASLVESQMATTPQWMHFLFTFLVMGLAIFFIILESQIDSRGSFFVFLVIALAVMSSSSSTDAITNDLYVVLVFFFFSDCCTVCGIQLGSMCSYCVRPTHLEFRLMVPQHSGTPLRLKLAAIERKFSESSKFHQDLPS